MVQAALLCLSGSTCVCASLSHTGERSPKPRGSLRGTLNSFGWNLRVGLQQSRPKKWQVQESS